MNLNRIAALLLTISCAAAFAQAPAEPIAPAEDPKLLQLGDQAITQSDFRANLERLPESARKLADANPERNRTMVENLMVNRALAARARADGLDRDPLIQKRLQLQEESFLASQYLALKRRQTPLPPGVEERAREQFIAAPERYRLPERLHIQSILVDFWGRTRDMALERVKEARARAAAGEDFLALAKEYSDDPAMKRNRGDVGFVKEGQVDSALWSEARKALSDGQISDPVPTKAGYYLVKRIAYQEPIQPAFNDLKAELIELEHERVRDEATNALPSAVLQSADLQWNFEAMAALTRKLSPEEQRQLEQAITRPPPSRRGR